MECERFNRLIRTWYSQLQEEALAPARMVEFMEKHLRECEICLADPDVRYEVKKITAIVTPESKTLKPVKKVEKAMAEVPEEGDTKENSATGEEGEEKKSESE